MLRTLAFCAALLCTTAANAAYVRYQEKAGPSAVKVDAGESVLVELERGRALYIAVREADEDAPPTPEARPGEPPRIDVKVAGQSIELRPQGFELKRKSVKRQGKTAVVDLFDRRGRRFRVKVALK